MSQKWIRSKRWDDEHIPRALWPVKWLLRTFSGIPLAVVLLTLVAVYGTLASVPVGMLAQIPTYVLYGLTAAAVVAVVAGVPMLIVSRVLRNTSPAVRFPVVMLGTAALAVAAVGVWWKVAWPSLYYDFGTGRGFMLFADFVREYRGTTLRRIPGLEMTEQEFYAWWPLRVILILFVVNMVVATVRRIEFTFPNIGVLTVHTGIVTIALGSVYYAAGKQEGDMLLRAGPPDATGKPTPGPIESGFFSRERPVLWVGSDGRYEQRPLVGVPRYNDYNLNVLGTLEPGDPRGASDRGRTLDIDVPPAGGARGESGSVAAGVRFEVVGYASYAELEEDWAPAGRIAGGAAAAGGTPMRSVELISSLPDQTTGDATPRSVGAFRFLPEQPAARGSSIGGAFGVEYTRGMSEERWSDLSSVLPAGAAHALVIEVPAAGFKQVYAAEVGKTIEVGETGYRVTVRELMPRPPMPIVTPGYQNAQSSVAIVRVEPPVVARAFQPVRDGQAGEEKEEGEKTEGGKSTGWKARGTGESTGWKARATAFDRWIYHRFPEISQDLLEELNERGMPKRRAADPAIRIGYIDALMIQVYMDERPGTGAANDPEVRVLIRPPGGGSMTSLAGLEGMTSSAGEPVVLEGLRTGREVRIAPVLALRLAERWDRAVRVEVPRIVPENDRKREAIGTHQQAAIALRVSAGATAGGEPWSTTLWVPFTQYLGVDPSTERKVALPDGRQLTVAFGRQRFTMPGLSLQLADFEMIPYPHSDTPRDYRSDLVVYRQWRGGSDIASEKTSLNYPLKASPFTWSKERSWPANALDWTLIRFSPMQYKFSQAGWDAPGWTETKAAADKGELPRPFARFTILGVGNNPGIYVIAAGAVMMSVGIPWAFYVKPLIVRARKRRIQRELAAGRRDDGVGGVGSSNGQHGAGIGAVAVGSEQ